VKYFNKKSVALVFLTLIIFSAMPKTAFAAVPVFETNQIIVGKQTLLQSITSIFQKATNLEQLFEWAFKIAAESLKRQLLNMIVDQIVVWIQGGGTPKFITDWPGFFRDAVDAAGGNFLKQLGLGLFCSPYNLTLRAAFIPIPKFSDRSACTLSGIGVNIDNFLKNFNNGGWAAWNEMVLKPQNNIYGAYLLVTTFIGYFGVLDFGVGTAVAKYIAEFVGKKDREGAGKIINSSLFFYIIVGFISAASLLILSPSE